MPVTVVEAMACGLCVISTDAGGVPWLLTNRDTGMLVPVGDTDAMTAAVVEVLSDRSLARTLSGRSRAYAEQFDWSYVLAEWQTLFEAIPGRRDG
jgi:glycosyltransferase involved in cell wall biosynthesis